MKTITTPNLAEHFGGFHPPTSNTTYTPNQFFDVCLPNCSRGVVRLVGFMLRKTLGWCDENGNPQETIIPISYEVLIKEANISKRALKQTIDEAVKGNFVRLVRSPKPKKRKKNFVSGLLELKWDERKEYIKDPDKFNGFFAREGNRTYVPNDFFDITIKTETLRVSKVVGAIIRWSIGYQNKYGHRRQKVQMSVSEIAYYSNITIKNTHKALMESINANYVMIVEQGFIDFSNSSKSSSSVYSINWCDCWGYRPKTSVKTHNRGKKDNEEKAKKTTKKKDQKPSSLPLLGAKKTTKGKQEKQRGKSKKNNDLYKQIKPLNKTFKQHNVAVHKGINDLLLLGFSKKASEEIITYHTFPDILSIITNQIKWLSQRPATTNKLGFLRKAIKENWEEPQSNSSVKTLGLVFSKGFYAGFSGTTDQSTVVPTSNEISLSDTYVQTLLKVDLSSEKPLILSDKWGREFGKLFKKKTNNKSTVYISLPPALRSFGDEFYLFIKDSFYRKTLPTNHSLSAEDQQSLFPSYLIYLRESETTIKISRKEEYTSFLSFRLSQKTEMETSPFSSKTWLLDFPSEESRLSSFQSFFKNEVFSFEDWVSSKQVR